MHPKWIALFLVFVGATVAAVTYEENYDEFVWMRTYEESMRESYYRRTKNGVEYFLLPNPRGRKAPKIQEGHDVKVMYKLFVHNPKSPRYKPADADHHHSHDHDDHPEEAITVYAEDHHFVMSQANEEDALEVVVGRGDILPGFEECLLRMRRGERGRFLVPPELAYGEAGNAGLGIPSNAFLEYFIEVVEDWDREARLKGEL